MRRRSVRLRTALAATLALAPLLTAVSVAGVLLQRHQLTAGVEVLAREHARTVAADLSAGGPAPLPAAIGGESTLVQVVDARGQVEAATPALDGRAALVDPVVGAAASRVTGLVAGEGDHYLVVTAPASGGRIVVAAESLESVDDATTTAAGLLVVGDPLLVVLVAVLTYWLVGRALRPVEALRARAAVITAADQRARLPVVATGDEVERLARTLNEMLSRLEVSAQAQKRFVADASHELRSPVATIRTLTEVAGARADVADWVSVSSEVLAETARLERLVDDLLLLARPSLPPGRAVEPIDLGALVREEAARARVVPVRADPVSVVVVGQRDSLARALRNLLDNAERHARRAIDVEVSVRRDHALLTVRDDGAGISAEDHERVFERFVRLDEARTRDGGGSGLGLAITRHVAQAHGGGVRVAPSETGATFELELPLRSSAGRTP